MNQYRPTVFERQGRDSLCLHFGLETRGSA
jgi:hypothetical protein